MKPKAMFMTIMPMLAVDIEKSICTLLSGKSYVKSIGLMCVFIISVSAFVCQQQAKIEKYVKNRSEKCEKRRFLEKRTINSGELTQRLSRIVTKAVRDKKTQIVTICDSDAIIKPRKHGKGAVSAFFLAKGGAL